MRGPVYLFRTREQHRLAMRMLQVALGTRHGVSLMLRTFSTQHDPMAALKT